MDIAVIIPVLNEAAVVEEAIGRAWEAGAADVIVADGGSRDGTLELAALADCRLCLSAPGRARQQNAAADMARSEVLLFQHADNWLEPKALRQVAEAMKHPGCEFGAFRQRIDARGWRWRILASGNAWRVRWRRLPYGDQSIFVRREVFRALGGFPDVPLMEDVMLAEQLRRRSAPVLLPGPLHISARRWQRYGIVRQTLRNWTLLAAYKCGWSPDRLAQFYPRHDAK